MTSGTGTRQSTSATGRPLKPRKFRSSCDGCSASKVKCNQDTPQCSRCINLGLKCNYSPSRRMGKPPASSRKLKTATYSSSSPESEHSNYDLSPPPPLAVHHIQQLSTPDYENNPFHLPTGNSSDFMFLDWQDNTFHAFANKQPDAMELPLTATGLFDQNVDIMLNTVPQIPKGGELIFNENAGSDSNIAPSPVPTYGPFLQNFPTHPSPQINTSPRPSSTSLKLQTNIGDFQETYSPYPRPMTSSIDQMLINNRSGIEEAYGLLSNTCSNSPYSALSIALLCTKILEMYEEVVRALSTTCISPISGRRRSVSDAISITVGAYKMDADDEERIRIQIVLIELRKVQGLVDTFATKYCHGVEGGNRSGDDIYLALERFLRSKLADTLQNLAIRAEN